MPYCRNGMIYNHSRSCPAHDCPYTLFHLRLVAVDGTFLARWLSAAVAAMVQPADGIIRKFPAFRAERPVPFMPPAVHAYHQSDDNLLFFYAFIHKRRLIFIYFYICFSIHAISTVTAYCCSSFVSSLPAGI